MYYFISKVGRYWPLSLVTDDAAYNGARYKQPEERQAPNITCLLITNVDIFFQVIIMYLNCDSVASFQMKPFLIDYKGV